MTEASPRRLVAPDLFGEDEHGAYLCGSECRLCGEIVVPPMLDCPKCMTFASMHPTRVPGRAIVRDFVVAHRGGSGFAVPYIQAYVQLDAGPVIYTMIDVPVAEDAVTPGDPVRMHLATIRHDDDGVAVIGWKFAPAEKGAAM